MITIRKLASLQKSTALRKIVSLLEDFEIALVEGRKIDIRYLGSLIDQIIAPADRSFTEIWLMALG